MDGNTYSSGSKNKESEMIQGAAHQGSGPETIQKSWGDLSIHNFIKIGIIGVLFCWLFNHEIRELVGQWSDPSWSHGILIPLFSLYFVHQHKNEILNAPIKTSYLGLFFIICGIIFYPLNVVHFQYGYLGPLTMIVMLGAIVLFLGGWSLVKYTWLPIIFLIFAVPLPQRFYVSFTMPLRFLAAKVAAFMLNFVPTIDASVTGALIDIIYKGAPLNPPLDVAEACSGMRLLMAFLALGVAMAYLHYRPIWQRLILLAATIPIAVLCNVIRVTVTGFIHVLIGPEYAQGIYHDMLGILMLPLAFGFYYSLVWFMSVLFVEEQINTAEVLVITRKENQKGEF